MRRLLRTKKTARQSLPLPLSLPPMVSPCHLPTPSVPPALIMLIKRLLQEYARLAAGVFVALAVVVVDFIVAAVKLCVLYITCSCHS